MYLHFIIIIIIFINKMITLWRDLFIIKQWHNFLLLDNY